MTTQPHYAPEVCDFDGEKVMWLAVPVRYKRKSGYHIPEGTCCYVLRPTRKGRVTKSIRMGRILRFETCSDYPEMLLDLKQFAFVTGYTIFHVAKMVREKGIPFLVFDDKKWFLASDVDRWVQEAKAKRLVDGPEWGRKTIPRLGGLISNVRRRASGEGRCGWAR
jgi:hypothetical protein